jgi:hypothetical protein
MTPPVIITGMHRSGTSLLASLLHRAGLHLGDRLLGPGPANRQGYFEDLDFVELQDDVLAALGTTIFLPVPPRGTPGDGHRARARELIAARERRAAWGWKDPRSSLLLDFWLDLAPDARFVLAYRRPAEVVDSLRRRRDPALYRQYPGAVVLERIGVPRFRARHALHVWCEYNEAVVSFAERHVDRCHVVRSDALETSLPPVLETLARGGIPLDASIDPAATIDPTMIVRRAAPSIERLCARHRRSRALMARLDALADAGPRDAP